MQIVSLNIPPAFDNLDGAEPRTVMSRLLQVVADFCAWFGMRIKRGEKSVATGFVFKKGVALSTEGILYACAPLTGLAAHEAFAYLGVRASLVGVV